MSDWDDDSKQLQANLYQLLADIRRDAFDRVKPTVERVRDWHRTVMRGLATPGPEFVGRFRGEPGLDHCEVEIGDWRGVTATGVASELKAFEEKLQQTVDALDGLIEPNQDLSADDVAAVIDLCAWAHAEWVRIHPFANGNGRTARLWANAIGMRYSLPPFVRLRPRPDDGYGDACAQAMQGHWQPTVQVFRHMYLSFLRG